MPPDLALLSTLNGSNYPCLGLIFMVPKVFEPLKFDCICPNTLWFPFCSKKVKIICQRKFAVTYLSNLSLV